MLIKLPKTSDCKESDVTPESIYLSRRAVLGSSLAGLAVSALPRWANANDTSRYADVDPGKAPVWFADKLAQAKWQAVTVEGEAITPFKDATHYNNFYEFGTDKGDPAQNAGGFENRALDSCGGWRGG